MYFIVIRETQTEMDQGESRTLCSEEILFSSGLEGDLPAQVTGKVQPEGERSQTV